MYYNPNTYNQWNRNEADLDVTILGESSGHAKLIMQDITKLLDKLENDHPFDTQLMTAAQNSNYNEVYRLLSTLDFNSEYRVNFNPNGIIIEFRPRKPNQNFCNMSVSLRWR